MPSKSSFFFLLSSILSQGNNGFSVVPSQLQNTLTRFPTKNDGTTQSLFFTPDRSDNEKKSKDDQHNPYQQNHKYTQLEFKDLEPLPENTVRRERIERELQVKEQFEEFGDKLWELRSEMDTLSTQLMNAIQDGHEEMEERTREKLREVESRDPELVYLMALTDYQNAKTEGRAEDAKKYGQQAMLARSCLPQFNLEGLWIGKYGKKYELINITYVGDTLIAIKVTGDDNVPKSEITFQADLSPFRNAAINRNVNEGLQPILLTEKAAKKWGTRKLPRYSGLGQVAEAGFRNNQWLEGQLILIGDSYFSFAWLPIEQQIFFGRPSPELALKMIRESGTANVPTTAFVSQPSIDANLDLLKEYAMRCLEKTHEVEDEMENEFHGNLWYSNDALIGAFE